MSISPADTTDPQIAPPTSAHSWQRLSARIIWVDLVTSVLSTLPALVAIWVFGADAAAGQIWPLIARPVLGPWGAAFDVLRWIATRFRITATHVELKTGSICRQHGAIQRDRIRSVDAEAQVRHRLARMRVVKIGAG